MIRALAAASLLLMLAACGTFPAHPVAGKPAPAGPPPPPMPDDPVVCPADVKLCLDGSYVSRTSGHGCAFKRCPGERPQ